MGTVYTQYTCLSLSSKVQTSCSYTSLLAHIILATMVCSPRLWMPL